MVCITERDITIDVCSQSVTQANLEKGNRSSLNSLRQTYELPIPTTELQGTARI